ncbi:MAG: imidazole glycerol phosphate synthase subunit HisH [Euzebyales bacterium]|nr:imidazole glycerol phosphate synthase subunit HisH [Euzebyales bacterium]
MTQPLVAVLDYDAGNLRSVEKALERAGAAASVTADAAEADRADALVVPGVGHFGQCARQLTAAGFAGLLHDWVAAARPVLGICVGMQILYATSEEDPGAVGLGLVPGRVRRLPADVVVPHMGWDRVRVVADDPLLEGMDGERCYFANSYYAEPGEDEHVRAVCDYGPGFPCVVRTGSVAGTQFHPEKSAEVGARLLANFVRSLNV